MSTITYGDGTKINFNGTPTQQDVEDAYNQVKGGTKANSTTAGQVQDGMNQSDPTAQPSQPPPGGLMDALRSAATKVGNVVTGGFAQPVSQALATMTPEYKNLQARQAEAQQHDQQIMQMIQQARASGNIDRAKALSKVLMIGHNQPQPSLEDIATNGQGFDTNAQVIGKAVGLGANLLSGGSLEGAGTLPGAISGAQPALDTASKGIQAAQSLLGGGKLAEGTSLAARAAQLTGKAASGAITGGIQGAADAASNNQNILQGAEAGAKGGAATNAAFGVGENVINALQQSAANRAASLYDGILGLSKQEAKNQVKTGAQTTGQKLVENGGLSGFMKTKQGILDTATQGVQAAENKLKPLIQGLTDSGVKIPVADVLAPLHAIEAHNQELGLPASTAIQGIVGAIAKKADENGMLTPTVANDLKRSYYKELSNNNFNVPIDQLGSVKEAIRTAASGLRQGIENVSPQDETGNVIRQLNAEQGLHLQVQRKITDAIASGDIKTAAGLTKVLGNLVKPGNLAREGLAALAGHAALGPIGGIAVPVAAQALTSTPALTAQAKLATNFSKASVAPEINKAVRRLVTRGGASAAAANPSQ